VHPCIAASRAGTSNQCLSRDEWPATSVVSFAEPLLWASRGHQSTNMMHHPRRCECRRMPGTLIKIAASAVTGVWIRIEMGIKMGIITKQQSKRWR